jgi:hypothetical protein
MEGLFFFNTVLKILKSPPTIKGQSIAEQKEESSERKAGLNSSWAGP